MAKRGVSVGVEITGSAKGFKSSAEEAKKATEELRKKAASNSREIERNFKMVTIAMAKVTAAIMIVKEGFELYGKIMNQTNATGDKFEIQMAKIKGTFGEVGRSIATMNFKGLGDRMADAAKAGEDLAKQMDLIFDLSLRMKLVTSGTELAMVQQELIYKNKSNPWEVRKKAAEEYLRLVKVLETEQMDFAKQEVKGALLAGSVAASKIPEARLRWYIENIKVLAENEDAVKRYLSIQKNLDDELAKEPGSRKWGGLEMGQNPEKIKAWRAELSAASDIVKNFASDYNQFGLIIDPDRLKLTEAWANLDAVMKSAAESALKPMRTVNSLLKDETNEVKKTAKSWEEKKEAAESAFEAFSSYYRSINAPVGAAPGSGAMQRPFETPGTGGFQEDPFANSQRFQDQIDLINQLQGAFEGFFAQLFQGKDAFQALKDNFVTMLNQMVAAMAARAVIFGILSLITGGAAGAGAELFKAVTGGKKFGEFISPFAEGGIAYGSTIANVGEYSGAKSNPEVIAPLSKLKGMLGSQSIVVNLKGSLKGRDIYFSAERFAELLYNNT